MHAVIKGTATIAEFKAEKEKMEQVSFCTFGDGGRHITYVRMWQEEREK